ncbi:MAG: hypothetical protein VW455_06520 [Nitrospinota bacterium]
MAFSEIFLFIGIIALVLVAIFRNPLIGGFRLYSWLKDQKDIFEARGQTAINEKEKKAIDETLNACDQMQEVDLENLDLKSVSFSLIEKIASIYHPNVSSPMEQARLGDVLDVLQNSSQKILHIIHLPQINYVTRFRVIQVFGDSKVSSPEKNLLSGAVYRRFQIWVLRSLLIQWLLMVSESAIRVYRENFEEEGVEAEAILAEWETLQDEPEVSFPEEVQQIAEASKKEILFSATTISWQKASQLYFTLADQIARHYHPESISPIYEARVCDLLKSVSDSLEGLSNLGKKPVINKILNIRIHHLTQAKEMALPLGENKILDWVNRHQVGRIAKWSHSLYKTLQKKQPGILLRDVVFGLIKEGGKRWLVLYLHGKIAAEANKLYRR